MTDTTEQAVVETPAPDAIAPDEETSQVDAESSPAVNDADESSKPKPKGNGIQSRIDELTRLRYDAERDRDYWREMATRQPAPAKQEAAKPEAQTPRPKLEDFNYDEAAYEAALDAYYEKKADEIVDRKLTAREQERLKAERVKSWKAREAEFIAKTPDYIQLAYYAPINDAMASVIQESEFGPQIAYHLGKPENRAEAERIAQLDPVRAAREIGRLEATFNKPAPAPAPKPAVSKAPPPPPKIEATDSTPRVSTTSPESDSMSDEEWVKAEQARLKRKANRK